MGRTTAKVTKPICTTCAGTALIRRITTYPVRLTGPAPLTSKEIHVHRVALHECQLCGHLMPTPAGKAKVERCVQRGIDLFLGRLH
jgi:hypothetical protein